MTKIKSSITIVIPSVRLTQIILTILIYVIIIKTILINGQNTLKFYWSTFALYDHEPLAY